MQNYQTIVVGGGAAGIMAAISAAECGHQVAVLEANAKLGRKILISGNGRCNLTNLDADSLHRYHGGNPSFIRQVLVKYPLRETLDFFTRLGLPTKEGSRGRLFPMSDQAQSVVDVLEDRLSVLGIHVATEAKVTGLATSTDRKFLVKTSDGVSRRGGRVVLASGGMSLAKLGGNRSGIDLAQQLGHTSTTLLPGLVPLVSQDRRIHKIHGAKVWADVETELRSGRMIVETEDLLFTKYGVSGFAILNLSLRLVADLTSGPVEIRVNLFPGFSPEKVSELLKERWEMNPHRSVLLSFAGLLQAKVASAVLEIAGLPVDKRVETLNKTDRWRLAQTLTSLSVVVSEPRPFDFAEVTVGGIRTTEVNPESLESFLVPGLYFAGEMLDVQGDLGGFNFQWAWASGYLAGQGRET